MIFSPTDWRAQWDALHLPAEAVPTAPGFGEHYPWAAILQRAMSPAHRRKVAIARERMAEALALHPGAHLGWSAGKDSTALAAMIGEMGIAVPAFGEKDDLDYPAEVEYLHALGARFGITVDVLTPEVSLLQFLKDRKVSLIADLHGQTAALSSEHFYGLLRKHRQKAGYNAVILGLRSNESKHRAVNRASHGWMYERKSDGLTIICPIADWEDIDVHAYIASRDVPLMPLYLCVDPSGDTEKSAMRLRKSWFVAGGGPARYGHYVWLRRWWPDLWEKIADIDPEMRRLS
jgi:3'-phosphoadenosine 5'-phosphosulfate sulfotransferase (PAPS reductase)/FAD synthetase